MAIFHMRAQVISRSAGRSAIAAAAYRAGERLRDDRTGQTHDYSRKAHVEHREIMAPATAPTWMRDRAALWSAVEAAEKRKDAQLAREVHFALPRELSRAERVELIRDFCQREFVARGMICDIAVHNPPDGMGAEQPHAHVMLTTRVLIGDGFGQKDRDWNDKALYEGWRSGWAAHANRALERVGSPERIDHRSYAERGIDREPQPKLGPKAARLERAEKFRAANENRSAVPVTERGAEWQAVQDRNRARNHFHERLANTVLELREVAERVMAQARERLEVAWERIERAMASVRERFSGDRAARAGSEPVSGQRPPPHVEPPTIDKLLGREEPERDDRNRDKGAGGRRDRDAGAHDKSDQGKRDALLGKALQPTADRIVPTLADLLGRGAPNSTFPRPDRNKDDGRDR